MLWRRLETPSTPIPVLKGLVKRTVWLIHNKIKLGFYRIRNLQSEFSEIEGKFNAFTALSKPPAPQSIPLYALVI